MAENKKHQPTNVKKKKNNNQELVKKVQKRS